MSGWIGRALSLMVALLLVSCGGGGDSTSVSSSTSALSFSVGSGEQAISQSISVTLTQASGTVYAGASSDDSSLVIASFETTGDTTGRITVTPVTTHAAGTFHPNVKLVICGDPNCGRVIDTFNYSISITILPPLVVTPSSVSMTAFEGGSQQKEVAVTLPGGTTGTLSITVDNASAAPWLSAEVANASTIRLTASAAGIAASTRSGAVLVRFARSGGGTSSIRVPVNFTIGLGLVAPAAQQMTLNANSTQGSVSGAVPVARGDGGANAWSATSSAPWLVLSPASGTTPSSLGYSVDLARAASLAHFSDHTATVTISASGVSPVSFQFTLQKRLPYVGAAMPYGIPAARANRVVVSGGGFTQYANIATALQAGGLVVSNVQVRSDTQLAFTVTPGTAGSYVLALTNASSAPTPTATLKVAAADPYQAGSVSFSADKDTYVHDPVRQAVFGSSWLGNAIYKYQLVNGTWTVSSLAMEGPRNLGLAHDGSRLYVALANSLKEVDPDTMTVTATYPSSANMNTYGGPLPVSVDRRLWLPGGFYFSGGLPYFDLVDKTFKTQTGNFSRLESGAFTGSADGSVVLASPDSCCTPQADWHLYKQADGTVTNPMGTTQFGSDPRLSADGSRLMMQQTGQLYDTNYNLLGQLPDAASGEFWARLALTSDGTKILALALSGPGSQTARIDIFSTSSFSGGSTRFAKMGSIPVVTASFDCGSQSYYGCENGGRLILSHDDKAVFWIGNKRLQVFKLP